MGAWWRWGCILGLGLAACGGTRPSASNDMPNSKDCHPASCALLHANCGEVPDGCGGKLSCGSCDDGETCGGGGMPNVCGASPCSPGSCESIGANCGIVSDGCGDLLTCGECYGGQTCGGGGLRNICGSP